MCRGHDNNGGHGQKPKGDGNKKGNWGGGPIEGKAVVGGKEVEGSMKVAIEEVKREGGGGSQVMGKRRRSRNTQGVYYGMLPKKLN